MGGSRFMKRWKRAYPGKLVVADVFDLPLDLRTFDFWASPPCQLFSFRDPRDLRAAGQAPRDLHRERGRVPVAREVMGMPSKHTTAVEISEAVSHH